MAEAGTAAGERVRAYAGGFAVAAAHRDCWATADRAVTVALSSDLRSSLRSSGVSTCPARPTNSAMWYATTLMSQSGVACTPSSEPSLIDITNRLPSSIATIVCLTLPPSISLAAPMVRLPMPETIVARSAAEPLGAALPATASGPTGVPRPGVRGEQHQPVGRDDGDRTEPGHLLDEILQQPVQVPGFTAQSECAGRSQLRASSTLSPASSVGTTSDLCSEISVSTSLRPSFAPWWKPPSLLRRASASTLPVRCFGAVPAGLVTLGTRLGRPLSVMRPAPCSGIPPAGGSGSVRGRRAGPVRGSAAGSGPGSGSGSGAGAPHREGRLVHLVGGSARGLRALSRNATWSGSCWSWTRPSSPAG